MEDFVVTYPAEEGMKVKLVQWHVAYGERVKLGQMLCELEIKPKDGPAYSFDLEASVSGTIRHGTVEGNDVAENQPIGWIRPRIRKPIE